MFFITPKNETLSTQRDVSTTKLIEAGSAIPTIISCAHSNNVALQPFDFYLTSCLSSNFNVGDCTKRKFRIIIEIIMI